MNTKLSIIIPVYNIEKYLAKCIDSILNQTFQDFEVICINDGSTDSSLEILADYALEDRRIKIISQKNSGPATARNLGLKEVKGEFISFVDGDDWIEPNTYELTLQNMTDDIDLICFGTKLVIEKDFLLNENNIKSFKNLEEYYRIKTNGNLELNEYAIKTTTVNIWNKIFRTSIIKENNIVFLANLLCSEDVGFLYKYLFMCKRLYLIDETLYNYVQRPNSSMTKLRDKKLPRITDGCLAGYDIYQFLCSKSILKENLSSFLYIFYNRFYDDYICCDEANYSEFFEKVTDLALKIELPGVKDLLIQELRHKNYPECIKIVKGVFNHVM